MIEETVSFHLSNCPLLNIIKASWLYRSMTYLILSWLVLSWLVLFFCLVLSCLDLSYLDLTCNSLQTCIRFFINIFPDKLEVRFAIVLPFSVLLRHGMITLFLNNWWWILGKQGSAFWISFPYRPDHMCVSHESMLLYTNEGIGESQCNKHFWHFFDSLHFL